MSLGVVIKGPEGIVLAADSRVTLTALPPGGQPLVVNYDNATKLLSFDNPHNHVAAVTYGTAVIGLRTAHSFIPEFELTLPHERLPNVEDYARRMSEFFLERWNEVPLGNQADAPMFFLVGGYDQDQAYGSMFQFSIPNQTEPQPRNQGPDNFGMAWGGQLEVASRLISGYDPGLSSILAPALGMEEQQVQAALSQIGPNLQYRIPFQVLPLQDCIDLATFLLRTTMTAQALSLTVRGVGGPIEVAIITRVKGLEYIQQKQLHGEAR